MFKHFIFTVLLLSTFSVNACLTGGTNPDSAYTTPTATYADEVTACGSLTFSNPDYVILDIRFEVTGTVTCRYGITSVIGGVSIGIITGDEAYGECGGVTPEYAGVCNDGEIISDYRDPQCTDGTQFDANGGNIVVSLDTTTDIQTTTNTTVDDVTGNTTTEFITVTTDTTTTTSTAGDGTIVDQVADITETVETTTTVTDPVGTVISTTTGTTTSNNTNQEAQGYATATNNCDTPPICTGDPVGCATLYQIWQSSCLNYDSSVEPLHVVETSDYATTASSFGDRINNSPIMLSFSNMTNIVSSAAGTCPIFSIDLPAPINQIVSTTLHCSLFETIAPTLTVVMLAVYTFLGFRIVASA